jgi:hypothetical protein
MTSGEMPEAMAIRDAPRTSQSAPNTSRTRPATKRANVAIVTELNPACGEKRPSPDQPSMRRATARSLAERRRLPSQKLEDRSQRLTNLAIFLTSGFWVVASNLRLLVVSATS